MYTMSSHIYVLVHLTLCSYIFAIHNDCVLYNNYCVTIYWLYSIVWFSAYTSTFNNILYSSKQDLKVTHAYHDRPLTSKIIIAKNSS